MNTKKFNRWIFITSGLIFLFSLVGLILLGLPYLKVSLKYLGEVTEPDIYSGYQLIVDQSIMNACFEPLLHLVGFGFFLIGSLIFLGIEINNKFSKKKIEINLSGISKSKKVLTTIQIVASILLVAIAVLIIVFGFLTSPSPAKYTYYTKGVAKTINAILLGLDFLVLTLTLNVILKLEKK